LKINIKYYSGLTQNLNVLTHTVHFGFSISVSHASNDLSMPRWSKGKVPQMQQYHSPKPIMLLTLYPWVIMVI